MQKIWLHPSSRSYGQRCQHSAGPARPQARVAVRQGKRTLPTPTPLRSRATDPFSQQAVSDLMPTASGMVNPSTNPVDAHNLDGGAQAGK